MIYTNDIESDPHLIALRADLMQLEDAKDATYKASEADRSSTALRLACDVALMRWVHASVAYQRALRKALEL
jgi:hypothetical protein